MRDPSVQKSKRARSSISRARSNLVSCTGVVQEAGWYRRGPAIGVESSGVYVVCMCLCVCVCYCKPVNCAPESPAGCFVLGCSLSRCQGRGRWGKSVSRHNIQEKFEITNRPRSVQGSRIQTTVDCLGQAALVILRLP